MDYLQVREFARENRKNPTKAEKYVWSKVRGRKLFNLKISRQFVIPYKLASNHTMYFIADFYCHEMQLVIEVDGKIHDYQKEYDEKRSAILKAMGITVIRFANAEVLSDWSKVEVRVQAFLDSRGI